MKETKFKPLQDSSGKTIEHFFVYQKTGVIYYREKFQKLRIPPIFRSTHETTIGRAKTVASNLKQRHLNKHLGIDDTRVFGIKATRTFRSVAEEVLARVTPIRRLGTQENHKLYLSLLIEQWGSHDVNAINPKAFEEWISLLRKKKVEKLMWITPKI